MFRPSAVLVGLIAASSNAELLDEVWSYTYYSRSPDYWQDQQFLGISDPDGNLYWLLCDTSFNHGWPTSRGCRVRSADFDGKYRFEASIGSGTWGESFLFSLHLVADSVVIADHGALLRAFDTSTGSASWTRDFRRPGIVGAVGGVAYDGQGQIFVAAGSSIHALAATTGTTIWSRDLKSEDPKRVARLENVVLDESRNVYFTRGLCDPHSGYDCEASLISLNPDGNPRFEVQVERDARALAVAHGRIVLDQRKYNSFAELLDAETGARIVRLPGTLVDAVPWDRPTVLISRELGFFIQALSTDDAALAAFDLASGDIQWRFRLDRYLHERTMLLTDEGNILILNKRSLLEISPRGQLLREHSLGSPRGTIQVGGGSLLLRGRWFSQVYEQRPWPEEYQTVVAYDLPGAPGEGRVGWNSRRGNAQGENRPKEK